MVSYRVCRRFGWDLNLTDKVRGVMGLFGLDIERLGGGERLHECEIELGRGDVCYITGASGAGKSVMLRELYGVIGEEEDCLWLDDVAVEKGKSLVDCIEGDIISVLRVLSKAGLSDAFSVLNSPDRLSEGQKYRYKLARAIASGAKVIFADEFCSNLDRITAAVIAHNIGRLAKETGVTFVLASCHDDLLCDLGADVIVIKRLNGSDEVIYRSHSKQ